MKNLLLIIVSVLSFTACKKEEAKQTNLYDKVYLNLVDENGVNVLNSKLTIADLDLYYVTSAGDKILQNHENLDFPKNMNIVNEGVDKMLIVFANVEAQNNEYAESILKVKGYDDITIKVKVQKNGGSLGYSDLFLNGKNIPVDLRSKPIKLQLEK
ncbi:hypothetical protein [Chryseobacterium lathyri]|uniref:Uncharacterized protein n=1 Tax=Chryseobacterium lathyri TaxID=395933 RepID=A0A511Y7W7_9FLAO|nr:hypothetical protein [Chryseobacterium lathyri]GEN71289.1 hypothetical protein CLA01_13610 [Chryseobacterium lathyri]